MYLDFSYATHRVIQQPINGKEATQLYIDLIVLISKREHWIVNDYLSRDIEENSIGEPNVRRSSRVQVRIGDTEGRPGGGGRLFSLPKDLVLEALRLVEDVVGRMMYDFPDRIQLGSIYIATTGKVLGEITLGLGGHYRPGG